MKLWLALLLIVGCTGEHQMVSIRNTSRIFVIGDSLVANGTYDGIGTQALAYYKGGSGYRSPYSYLTTPTPSAPPLPTYTTSGVGGNKAADIDARIQADVINLSPQPTVVLVAIGVNDATAGTSTSAFTTSYTSIGTKLINGGILPANIGFFAILAYGDSWSLPNDTYRTAISDLNAVIAARATAIGATYIDTRTPQQAWEVANNPSNTFNGDIMAGGPHTTALGTTLVSGYQGWAWTSGMQLVPL